MSRQNYYARRRQRQRQELEHELVLAHVRVHRQTQPRLGTRKLHHLLRAPLARAGVQLGRDRLFNLLREHDLLVPPLRAAYPNTTDSNHPLDTFTNLEKGQVVTGPHQVLVGDITYVRTREGFLYLSLLTDKKSRKIVGYHCGDTLESSGCLAALEMALEQLPEGARPLHHTDRGRQYRCHEYVSKLRERGLTISMTERDHCAQNALAERMNGILKTEYGLGGEFASRAQGRKAVKQAIHLYNTQRPHRALGYAVPEQAHSLAA